MPHTGAQSWILVISELHRYQGVSYKSDIIVISGTRIISRVSVPNAMPMYIDCAPILVIKIIDWYKMYSNKHLWCVPLKVTTFLQRLAKVITFMYVVFLMLRSGYRRQTGSGAEVLRDGPPLSPGQFWWQVCAEGRGVQPHGCDQLSDGEERLQDAGISSAENSA